MKTRYLLLENGEVFEGYAFGGAADSVGELVFTTNMCGYIETLTDPSYYGQIVLQTFPLIGNYGIIPDDFEGKPFLKGYVVRELCDTPSNFRNEKTVDTFLKENNIPGIYGVDTRYITKLIRESGVMNAVITDFYPKENNLREYFVKNAVESVSTQDTLKFKSEKESFNVALIDFGAKKNIIRELIKRNCDVTFFPHSVKAEEILNGGFDGVMLSNGPGDPAENTFEIEQIRKIFGKIPIFGICLGHQLLALSQGGKTEKMKYGHRGGNQPVKETGGKRTYITSQNHGYAVVSSTVKNGRESFINANDGSCEGIDYEKAFSVQFHPEACSGPKDTGFLFDRFIKLMEENR